MSTPARELKEQPDRPASTRTRSGSASPKPVRGTPAPDPSSIRPAPTARTTAARPRPTSPPQPRVRARRGFHFAFWILAAATISAIVVGIVALNAMVVNTTYRMEGAQRAVEDLEAEQRSLSTEVATLSAPSNIAVWAETQRMVRPSPSDVVVLKVPGVEAGR